ncbi:MAG: winged helix-turn-helix transcriptional regulator [Chloroflexaceae bacterium]|nr:winged helix-turn-helix transcriptional regulator [Chloroflexaceae bacterium]
MHDPAQSSPNSFLASFQALSDPLRRQILELLRGGELCACDLSERLAVKQSRLSFHLKTLKAAKLIVARQESRWIYYGLNPSQFHSLESFLSHYQSPSFLASAHPSSSDRQSR